MKLDVRKLRKMKRLEAAIDARYRQDQVRMSNANLHVSELEGKVLSERKAISSSLSEVQSEVGSYLLWFQYRRWAERALEETNLKLALARAEQDEARRHFSISVGRREALHKISKE